MKKYLLFLSVLLAFSCGRHGSEVVSIDTEVSSDAHSVSLKATPLERKYNVKILPYLQQYSMLLKSGSLNTYSWTDNTSCNIGLLSQIITEMTVAQIDSSFKSYKNYGKFADKRQKDDNEYQPGSWTNLVSYECGITGKKVTGIIGQLQEAGFTALDISCLEYLSDNYILSKANLDLVGRYYGQKDNLIIYLDTWIDVIKSQKENNL